MKNLVDLIKENTEQVGDNVYVVKDEVDMIVGVFNTQEEAQTEVDSWKKADKHNNLTISTEKRSEYVNKNAK